MDKNNTYTLNVFRKVEVKTNVCVRARFLPTLFSSEISLFLGSKTHTNHHYTQIYLNYNN